MKAKYAQQIRIGIMARCLPYHYVAGFLDIDRKKLAELKKEYYLNAHLPLVHKAYVRTKRWVSVRD